ncbi:MAG TPA: hypothetical protein VMU29_06255 [Smithella sp.]|nr:hypothetical protein [Smithella sp.]
MSGDGLPLRKRIWTIANRQDLLTLFGIMTLLAGFGISVFIYLTADGYENSLLGYEVIGGSAYPIRPEDSKTYQRDLQMVGGKSFVLVDQFQRWFMGLWHGKSLAFVVAGITLLIAAGFFYAANNLPYRSGNYVRDENNRDNPL